MNFNQLYAVFPLAWCCVVCPKNVPFWVKMPKNKSAIDYEKTNSFNRKMGKNRSEKILVITMEKNSLGNPINLFFKNKPNKSHKPKQLWTIYGNNFITINNANLKLGMKKLLLGFTIKRIKLSYEMPINFWSIIY
jgi:hypothetical protein